MRLFEGRSASFSVTYSEKIAHRKITENKRPHSILYCLRIRLHSKRSNEQQKQLRENDKENEIAEAKLKLKIVEAALK